ncbi:MAG: V-type ATP synthase subunit E, partial [Acutalibacteraceae bacterium]
AREIISAAEKRADELVSEKAKEAEKEASEITALADKKAALIKSTGESSAQLVLRDAALSKKRELIEKALNSVIVSINNYDDKRYFDCLLRLAKKNAMNKNGEMLLSARDLSRDKDGFVKALKELSITVSDTSADIDGGFILKYGDIIINCELSAVMREKRDEITDAVNTALFG